MMLAPFDDLIGRVRACIVGDEGSFPCSTDAFEYRVGDHASKGVILKGDTAVELGGASGCSCAMTLVTSDARLVRDGRVTVAGKDVSDMPEDTAVPFAQVILVAGEKLDSEDYQRIEECQYVKDYIEGYLVRGSRGQIMGRVSRDLRSRGFGFAGLASALSCMVRSRVPHAQAVEVLFVAAAREGVDAVAAHSDAWRAASFGLRKARWLEKGIDIDCPYQGHCGSCPDRSLCGEIRKIANLRKEG